MSEPGPKSRMPAWVTALSEEDLGFLKRFLLGSGSLKELAAEYGVSYPTVRGRLDRLIAKVRAADEPDAGDGFERVLRVMVADGTLTPALARTLLAAHRAAQEQETQR